VRREAAGQIATAAVMDARREATAGEILTEREIARRSRRAWRHAAHRAGDPRVAGDAIAFLHAASATAASTSTTTRTIDT